MVVFDTADGYNHVSDIFANYSSPMGGNCVVDNSLIDSKPTAKATLDKLVSFGNNYVADNFASNSNPVTDSPTSMWVLKLFLFVRLETVLIKWDSANGDNHSAGEVASDSAPDRDDGVAENVVINDASTGDAPPK